MFLVLRTEMEIDIPSQLVQISNKLRVVNTNASPTISVLFTVEPQLKRHVAYFGASARDTKKVIRISIVPSPAGQGDVLTLQIHLPSELSKGKTINVEFVLTTTSPSSPWKSLGRKSNSSSLLEITTSNPPTTYTR
ncbi:unnamed protein product [Orchesella dallaii]|uniref:Uncharacterized protein n=1 Tax=Orchesella dallaii TaxID=48710 RepID=A0ABP1QBM0_9HEXA